MVARVSNNILIEINSIEYFSGSVVTLDLASPFPPYINF